MLQTDAAAILDTLEDDTRAVLYKARWDDTTASVVVPQLTAVLDSDDRNILMRALANFVTIGPAAVSAAPKITRLLQSPEMWVFQNAAIALAQVSLKKPEPAVQPLIQVAGMSGREKYAMLALINLGKAAKPARPTRTLGNLGKPIRPLRPVPDCRKP